jgi:uncharacterized protein YkwD
MKLINLSLGAFMALVLLVGCSPEVEENTVPALDLTAPISVENDHEMVQEILEAVNEYRSNLGLASLSDHQVSETLALNHSAYMAENNEASHDNFFQRSDYLINKGAESVSENVAYGYATAQSVLQGWLESPSHKAALEGDEFTHTGIAVVSNEVGIKFYTQLFVEQ